MQQKNVMQIQRLRTVIHKQSKSKWWHHKMCNILNDNSTKFAFKSNLNNKTFRHKLKKLQLKLVNKIFRKISSFKKRRRKILSTESILSVSLSALANGRMKFHRFLNQNSKKPATKRAISWFQIERKWFVFVALKTCSRRILVYCAKTFAY